MLLLVHVTIALVSILSVSLLHARPSKIRLKISYLSFAATVLSGSALIFTTGASLVRSCLIGLIYIFAMTYFIVGAKRSLARELDRIL